MISVLYVDDEQLLLDIGKVYLARTGQFQVDILESALTALDVMKTRSYDVVISDYQKGTVTTELCRQVLTVARQKRVAVFVDPKPEHPEICREATLVTPNLREAELMAGLPLRDRRQLETGGRRLLADLGCENLLITRGADGMTLFEQDGGVHEIASVPRPVYDVTGAGDTVVAVLALAYSAGATLREAAELANRAGGRVVLKFGTAEVLPQELLDDAGNLLGL